MVRILRSAITPEVLSKWSCDCRYASEGYDPKSRASVKRRGLRCHALYAEGSESAVARYVSTVPNEDGTIRVHVTSTLTKAEKAATMASHKVDKGRFLRLVTWLQRHNANYSDVELNTAAVEDLPEPGDGREGLLRGAFTDATAKANASDRLARSVRVMHTQPETGIEADGEVVSRTDTDVTIRYTGSMREETVPIASVTPISELIRPVAPDESTPAGDVTGMSADEDDCEGVDDLVCSEDADISDREDVGVDVDDREEYADVAGRDCLRPDCDLISEVEPDVPDVPTSTPCFGGGAPPAPGISGCASMSKSVLTSGGDYRYESERLNDAVGTGVAHYRLGSPVAMWKKEYWSQAFVQLFPFGTGGPCSTVGVSLKAYHRHVLSLSHRSFARDAGYVLTAFDVQRSSDGHLPLAVSARGKANTINSVTQLELAAAVREVYGGKGGRDWTKVSPATKTFLSTISAARARQFGTAEESTSFRIRLYSMRRLFGASAIWFTFSPEDARVVTALYEAGLTPEEVKGLTLEERRERMAENPVASAVGFRKQLLALLKIHFNWEPEKHRPIDGAVGAWGRIVSYFLCVEEQMRGSIHAHLCAWVAGVPATLDGLLDHLRETGLHKVDVPQKKQRSKGHGTQMETDSPEGCAVAGTPEEDMTASAMREDSPSPLEQHVGHCPRDQRVGKISPLVKLLARSVFQTNYLPSAQLVCLFEGCGGALRQDDELPPQVRNMKAVGPTQMPEPKLLRCGTCQRSCSESAVVDAWIASRLGPDATCDDNENFATPVTLSNPVFKGEIDGVDAELTPTWVHKLTENDLALLAIRARDFQKHNFKHTRSCFKSKKQNKGRCRYRFPQITRGVNVVVTWKPEAVQKDVNERTAWDVDSVEFVPERGESGAYMNRHSPAVLMLGQSNNDFCLVR